jgi:hypothetical protein
LPRATRKSLGSIIVESSKRNLSDQSLPRVRRKVSPLVLHRELGVMGGWISTSVLQVFSKQDSLVVLSQETGKQLWDKKQGRETTLGFQVTLGVQVLVLQIYKYKEATQESRRKPCRENKEAWGVGFNPRILQDSRFSGGNHSRRQGKNLKEKQ